MTRSQVAKRLGKSIATVRRLEKRRLLKPDVDDRGIHRFNAKKVEELAENYRDLVSLKTATSEWLRKQIEHQSDPNAPLNRFANAVKKEFKKKGDYSWQTPLRLLRHRTKRDFPILDELLVWVKDELKAEEKARYSYKKNKPEPSPFNSSATDDNDNDDPAVQNALGELLDELSPGLSEILGKFSKG